MTFPLARAALRARLLTVPGLPAARAWENRAFVPALGTPYAREDMVWRDERVASLSGEGAAGGLLHARGLWQVTLSFPAGGDTAPAETLAVAVASAFKPGTNLAHGGLAVTCTRAVMAAALARPDWYALPVTVDFYFHRPNA